MQKKQLTILLLGIVMTLLFIGCPTETDNSTTTNGGDLTTNPDIVPAVSTVTVTLNGNQAKVSWTAPTANVDKVEHYLVQIVKDGAETTALESREVKNTTEFTFSLVTGAAYKAQVTSVGIEGAKSDVVSSEMFNITTQALSPTAPVALTSSNVTQTVKGNKVELAITVPKSTSAGKDNNGQDATIAFYTLFYKAKSTSNSGVSTSSIYNTNTSNDEVRIDNYDTKIILAAPTDNSDVIFTIYDLEVSTEYSIIVVVTNSVGLNATGLPFSFSTLDATSKATAPDAPNNLTVTPSENAISLVITWDEPTNTGTKEDESKAAITKYLVFWQEYDANNANILASKNSLNKKEVTEKTVTLTRTDNSLKTKQAYSVIVVAVNDATIPLQSVASKSVIASTVYIDIVPAVSTVTVTLNGNQAKVSWTAPTANVDKVEHYLVQIVKDGAETTALESREVKNTTEFTFSLVAGTAYKAQVTSVGIEGAKSDVVSSEMFNITTQALSPTAPVALTSSNVTQTVKGNKVEIAITVPKSTSAGKDNNGQDATIAFYTLFYKAKSTSNSGASTSSIYNTNTSDDEVRIDNYDTKIILAAPTDDSDVIFTIYDLEVSTEYSIIVVVTNSVGLNATGLPFSFSTLDATSKATAPDAPNNLTVTPSENAISLVITWDEPTNTGTKEDESKAAITKYLVFWQEYDANNTNVLASKNSLNKKEVTEKTVTLTRTDNSLKTKQAYSVIVVAVNDATTPLQSVASKSVIASTVYIDIVPAVSTVTVTLNGNQAKVSWTAPTANVDKVEHYLVQIVKDGAETTALESREVKNTTEFTFSLVAGTAYKAQVTSVGIEGAKSDVASSEMFNITTQAQSPTAPVALTSSNVTQTVKGNKVELAITVPKSTSAGKDNNGQDATIAFYTLFYKAKSTSNSGASTSSIYNTNTSDDEVRIDNYDTKIILAAPTDDSDVIFTIYDLEVSTEYSIIVVVTNSVGLSATGLPFSFSTLDATSKATAPDAPNNLTVTPSENAISLVITWDEPTNTGTKEDESKAAITKYLVFWQEYDANNANVLASKNSLNKKEVTEKTVTLTRTDNSVKTKQAYSVIVVAVNDATTPLQSVASKSVIASTVYISFAEKPGVPGDPSKDIVYDKAYGLQLAWTTPTTYGKDDEGKDLDASSLRYRVYYAPSTAGISAEEVIAANEATSDALASTSFIITSLDADTAYAIVVKAFHVSLETKYSLSGVTTLTSNATVFEILRSGANVANTQIDIQQQATYGPLQINHNFPNATPTFSWVSADENLATIVNISTTTATASIEAKAKAGSVVITITSVDYPNLSTNFTLRVLEIDMSTLTFEYDLGDVGYAVLYNNTIYNIFNYNADSTVSKNTVPAAAAVKYSSENLPAGFELNKDTGELTLSDNTDSNGDLLLTEGTHTISIKATPTNTNDYYGIATSKETEIEVKHKVVYKLEAPKEAQELFTFGDSTEVRLQQHNPLVLYILGEDDTTINDLSIKIQHSTRTGWTADKFGTIEKEGNYYGIRLRDLNIQEFVNPFRENLVQEIGIKLFKNGVQFANFVKVLNIQSPETEAAYAAAKLPTTIGLPMFFDVYTEWDLLAVLVYDNKGSPDNFNSASHDRHISIYIRADIDMTNIDPAWYAGKSMGESLDFQGKLHGNNHTIKGMTIGSADAPVTNAGFFGVISEGDPTRDGAAPIPTFENITFENFTVYGTNDVGVLAAKVTDAVITNVNITGTTTVNGIENVGGIVGNFVSGTLTLDNNTVNATVTATGDYAGGVIGNVSGTNVITSITAVQNTGNISGRDYVGGIAGHAQKVTIVNNSNTGTITATGSKVGGLVGETFTTVSGYSTGNVSTSKLDGEYIGGLVGFSNTSPTLITGFEVHGYATGDVQGGYRYIGGLVGQAKADVMGYATGNVSYTNKVSPDASTTSENIGGLIGSVENGNSKILGYATGNVGPVSSVATTTISGGIGGLIGKSGVQSLIGYATGNVEGNNKVGGLIGTLALGGIGYAAGKVTGTGTAVAGIGTVPFDIFFPLAGYWDIATSTQSNGLTDESGIEETNNNNSVGISDIANVQYQESDQKYIDTGNSDVEVFNNDAFIAQFELPEESGTWPKLKESIFKDAEGNAFTQP